MENSGKVRHSYLEVLVMNKSWMCRLQFGLRESTMAGEQCRERAFHTLKANSSPFSYVPPEPSRQIGLCFLLN
jgi:transposase